jgi:hypothetical protein
MEDRSFAENGSIALQHACECFDPGFERSQPFRHFVAQAVEATNDRR